MKYDDDEGSYKSLDFV